MKPAAKPNIEGTANIVNFALQRIQKNYVTSVLLLH
jgi:hypothetical protein